MPLFFRAVLDEIYELSPPDHIDSGGNRLGMCHHGLFLKLFDPAGFIHPDRTEPGCVLIRPQFLANHCDVCFLRDMILKHFIVIQLVHRISGCDDNVRLMTFSQEIKILINGVRRTSVPVSVIRRNRRGEDVKPSLLSSEIPPLG